jgi:hypothetical protein
MSMYESADLILKLYDLRREETMRKARAWIMTFFPETAGDVMQAMLDETASGYYRMVVTYWDMAASFVNRGAIDQDLFLESSGEATVVFAKIQPFLPEIRQMMSSPNYLKNLETLIMGLPDAEAMLASRREMIKQWMQARAEKSQSA